MSFWDTLGGLFTGDTYYPDNENREARVTQLAGDCRQYSAQLALDATAIKQKLASLNDALADAVGGADKLPSTAQVDELKFAGDKWAVNVSQLIVPLVTYPAVSAALTAAATSYLVGSGELGAAALVGLVGLPVAFEVAVGVAAGVFAIGAVFGVGAIAGAVKRTKLQDTIHQAIPGRVTLYKAYLVNHKLLQQIDAMTMALAALKAAGVAQDTVINNVRQLVTEARAEIDKTTDDVARAGLAAQDTARHAWTNEDS